MPPDTLRVKIQPMEGQGGGLSFPLNRVENLAQKSGAPVPSESGRPDPFWTVNFALNRSSL